MKKETPFLIKRDSTACADWLLHISRRSNIRVRVLIFETKNDVLSHLREIDFKKYKNSKRFLSWKNYVSSGNGWCMLVHNYASGNPQYIEVILLRKMIGSGYVSHELYHSVERVKLLRKCDEEKCAEIMECLTKQFWNKFYARFEVK